jgi:hypothetical protein
VELGVEVERPSIPIPEELVLESEPRLARSVRLVADDVLELNGDGVVEPREDNAVHEAPGARRRSVVVDKDVIVEDETPQREKDLSSPTGVVGRRRIQHHGHEGPDVVQSSGLSVESSDEVSVEVRGEGVLRGFHRGDRRATEEALRGGHLGGQSGTQGTLSLQGEGGGTLALPRGRHCSLDRSEGADERGVGGGEYGGRDGVAPGWGSEGGKTRRGAATQGQRGSDVEWPEAGDVGGPSMGELAADCSRGNGGCVAGLVVPMAASMAAVVATLSASIGAMAQQGGDGRGRLGGGVRAGTRLGGAALLHGRHGRRSGDGFLAAGSCSRRRVRTSGRRR